VDSDQLVDREGSFQETGLRVARWDRPGESQGFNQGPENGMGSEIPQAFGDSILAGFLLAIGPGHTLKPVVAAA